MSRGKVLIQEDASERVVYFVASAWAMATSSDTRMRIRGRPAIC